MIKSFSFSDLSRRVANLVRIGKIAEVKDAQVKVSIGKVTTNWLPILSTAGETSFYIPISVGEQVMVISPYGEMSQAVVLRSIHYNNFVAPEDKESISFSSKTDFKVNGEGKFEALFTNGFEFNSGNLSIKVSDGQIRLTSGHASIAAVNDGITIASGSTKIALSDSGIQLSCGPSRVDVDSGSISLNSSSISTMPPLCKCLGGV